MKPQLIFLYRKVQIGLATYKYDYVYLNPANNGLELYQRLKEYINYYNHTLHHQGIGRKIPAELYKSAA